MALSKETQPNYQRQADIVVANHASEISTPISHVGEHIEATHIEIAGGEDPWETNDLGSGYIRTLSLESHAKRAARKPGEFSASFKDLSKEVERLQQQCPVAVLSLPENSCLRDPELKKTVLDLAKVYEKAGVQECDQIKIGLMIKEAHRDNRVGTRFKEFVTTIATAVLGD